MTTVRSSALSHRLTTPRGAALAGIGFALLYGTTAVLIRLSIPDELTRDSALWLEQYAGRVNFALNLVPYAGIAFLWFMGVLRHHMDAYEDRFYATVFLGSGLLFLGMTFIGAALAGGLLTGYALEARNLVESGVFTYARASMFQAANIYAVRMAGLFMTTLAVIWYRARLLPRRWAYLTYGLAVILLVAIGFSLWVILIFPIWVLVISTIILIRTLRGEEFTSLPEGRAL